MPAFTPSTCPRCGDPLHEREVMNSLSRVDNKTYICSPCGNREAMWNWSRPGQDLPGVTVDLRAVV